MVPDRSDLSLEEYKALRATIRERGTLRLIVTAITGVFIIRVMQARQFAAGQRQRDLDGFRGNADWRFSIQGIGVKNPTTAVSQPRSPATTHGVCGRPLKNECGAQQIPEQYLDLDDALFRHYDCMPTGQGLT